MADKPKGHFQYRSSVTGKLVKDSYGKSHPNSTQRELIPAPGRGDSGRGGGKKR